MPERPRGPRQNPERPDNENKAVLDNLGETIEGSARFLANDMAFNEVDGRRMGVEMAGGESDPNDRAISEAGNALYALILEAEVIQKRFKEAYAANPNGDLVSERSDAQNIEVKVLDSFVHLKKLLLPN